MYKQDVKIKLADGWEYTIDRTLLATIRAMELEFNQYDNEVDYGGVVDEVVNLLSNRNELNNWIEIKFNADEIKKMSYSKRIYDKIEIKTAIVSIE